MSNEELAAMAQSGDNEALLTLWKQVRRLVMKNADKWARVSTGAEAEDFEMAGFLALMRAVASFNPAAGCKFSTWFVPIMKGEFARAAGRETEKRRRDPLQAAVSLDIPVGEDEDGATLGDIQPDPAAERSFEDVECRADISRLHAALMEALDALPPCQKSAVLARFWGGRTLEHSEAQNLHLALRTLRNPRLCLRLRAFL